jgi:hypothetical protein
MQLAMQLARPRRRVVLLTVVVVALFAVGNAYADSRAISDGNDRPGPLDIRSASHAHNGERIVHTISTFNRWRLGVLGPNTPNLFAVEISTDGDRALERVVLVFSRNGHLVAPIIRLPSGAVVGSASASRPNSRTVRVSIRRSLLGNPSGYRWNAHSQYRKAGGACSQFCIDRAPNRGRVLHDITAPRAFFFGSWSAVPPAPEYDVDFSVFESGGSGLASWRLEHRSFGETMWSVLASGVAGGSKTYHQIATQGDIDQFRIVAADHQGNRTVTPVRTVSVPIDDTNVALTYSSGWSVLGLTSAFLGTLHSGDDDGLPASVTYAFSGSYFAIVAPTGNDWIDSKGSVFVDGIHVGDFFPGNLLEGSRRIVFSRGGLDPDVSHTLRIDVAQQWLPLDGIIVR